MRHCQNSMFYSKIVPREDKEEKVDDRGCIRSLLNMHIFGVE